MSKENKEIKCNPNSDCCSPSNTANILNTEGVVRRDFIKKMGLLSGGLMFGFPSFALNVSKKPHIIPIKKGFSNLWYKNLYKREKEEIYTGIELPYIGMPIGGLFSGTVYLGGDGKLWLWDIFNEQKEGVINKTHKNWQGKTQVKPRDGANFIFPATQEYPFEQGFGIKIKQKKKKWTKSLDFKGFNDISFKGQYPVGEVNYKDKELPVEIKLNSFSPFVPLDVDSSSYPATIMQYKVTNKTNKKVTIELSGWLENAVLNNTTKKDNVQLQNSIVKESGNTLLVCEAQTNSSTIKNSRDYGNMSLLLLDSSKKVNADAGVNFKNNLIFPKNKTTKVSAKHGEQLCGSVSKKTKLKPNQTKEITFIISWYFPNIILPEKKNLKIKNKGRYYKKRFKNAKEVGLNIAKNYEELYKNTINWRQTFYEESTLPHWFLNRTFLNTSILATETCFLLEDGRFWAWEGIGCCAGTCTHVWHYAQALGRLFPELEKNLREKTDFRIINKSSGAISFRGDLNKKNAADGQAGIVLRAYRDYLISDDEVFLKKNWKNIKLTLQYLINLDKEDGEADGSIFGEQHNTLDAEWYGNIPVITSLYLAALAAAIEMATVMIDVIAEKYYTKILEKGKLNIEKLFNGEYFIQKEDPKHKNAIGIGSGCYIDQVFGQSWAFQLGLGRLYNKEMIQSSLESLWKYNFVPDIGVIRESISPELNGRPYALKGDAGLIMCTWPLGGKRDDWEKHWQFGYFNECMTGFEHQVASHMIWEGKLDYGFTILKAIHQRYSASKRNPYNEIECSDHYSRAMASYGAFIAVCGFTYNGPKQQLGFAPKISSENFKAAFTSAQGWGNIAQRITKNKQINSLKIIYGKLSLKVITIEIANDKTPKLIQVLKNNEPLKFLSKKSNKIITVSFESIQLKKNDIISVVVNT